MPRITWQLVRSAKRSESCGSRGVEPDPCSNSLAQRKLWIVITGCHLRGNDQWGMHFIETWAGKCLVVADKPIDLPSGQTSFLPLFLIALTVGGGGMAKKDGHEDLIGLLSRLSLLLAGCVAGGAASCGPADSPAIQGSVTSIDLAPGSCLEFSLGSAETGMVLEQEYTLHNPGSGEVAILGTSSSCGCQVASLDLDRIAPHGEALLRVALDTGSSRGPMAQTVFLTVQEDGPPFVVRVVTRVDVTPTARRIYAEPATIDRGNVRQDQVLEGKLSVVLEGFRNPQITTDGNEVAPTLEFHDGYKQVYSLPYRFVASGPSPFRGEMYIEAHERGTAAAPVSTAVQILATPSQPITVSPSTLHLGMLAETPAERVLLLSVDDEYLENLEVEASSPWLTTDLYRGVARREHRVLVTITPPASVRLIDEELLISSSGRELARVGVVGWLAQ